MYFESSVGQAGKQAKGKHQLAMLTSDIETLEVFYAHTLSPICIAILVSFSVCLFTWLAASPWLALVALIGYLVIGIVVPMISSAALKEPGVTYRKEFASFNAYYLDSIKGLKTFCSTMQEKKESRKSTADQNVFWKRQGK